MSSHVSHPLPIKTRLTAAQKEARKARVWFLATRIPRRSLVEIGQDPEVNLRKSAVYNYIQEVMRDFAAHHADDVARVKFEQVALLEQTREEAWSAWLASRKQRKEVTKIKSKWTPADDLEKAKGTTGEQDIGRMRDEYGDPRFLDIFLRACADIRRILGAEAPIAFVNPETVTEMLARRYDDEQRKIQPRLIGSGSSVPTNGKVAPEPPPPTNGKPNGKGKKNGKAKEES